MSKLINVNLNTTVIGDPRDVVIVTCQKCNEVFVVVGEVAFHSHDYMCYQCFADREFFRGTYR